MARRPDKSKLQWPGWRPALGMAILGWEFAKLLALHRPLEKEIVGLALVLIAWDSQKDRHSR